MIAARAVGHDQAESMQKQQPTDAETQRGDSLLDHVMHETKA